MKIVVDKYTNELEGENASLRKEVHEYGNLVQRLYLMVMPVDDNRRDDEILIDVYEELDAFIKNQKRG